MIPNLKKVICFTITTAVLYVDIENPLFFLFESNNESLSTNVLIHLIYFD